MLDWKSDRYEQKTVVMVVTLILLLVIVLANSGIINSRIINSRIINSGIINSGIKLKGQPEYTAAEQSKGGDQHSRLYGSFPDLNGKVIGVQTGSSFDASVQEKLPEARVEYFNGKAGLLAALTGHKTDAFIVDEPVARIFNAGKQSGDLSSG